MALALVVVEEDARRAVHLRDDHALRAVDDEGAVHRHERHVAHVDVLLLDVLDGLGAGIGIHIEHDEAQRHLQGRRKRHAALTALVDVELRLLELELHEFEERRAGEIGNRENGLEDRLQAFVGASALGFVNKQKLVVGGLLNLDEVRHFSHFADVAEELADPFAASERLRHVYPRTFRLSRPCWTAPHPTRPDVDMQEPVETPDPARSISATALQRRPAIIAGATSDEATQNSHS